MTERVTRINVAELTTVRVTCRACGITTELALERAPRALADHGRCRHCQADLLSEQEGSHALHRLQIALMQLAQASERVSVEFAIVERDGDA